MELVPLPSTEEGLGVRAREPWEMDAFPAALKLEGCKPGLAGGYHTGTQTSPPKKPVQGKALPREGGLQDVMPPSQSAPSWNLIQPAPALSCYAPFCLSGQFDLDFCLLQTQHF